MVPRAEKPVIALCRTPYADRLSTEMAALRDEVPARFDCISTVKDFNPPKRFDAFDALHHTFMSSKEAAACRALTRIRPDFLHDSFHERVDMPSSATARMGFEAQDMSNRSASCGPMARSPTHSVSTMVRKLWAIASFPLARTHPDVVQPDTASVSIPVQCSHVARSVQESAEACFLRITGPPSREVSSLTIWLDAPLRSGARRSGHWSRTRQHRPQRR